MCGRLNITDDGLSRFIMARLGIPFVTQTNQDLRPTQPIQCLIYLNGQFSQWQGQWGIKPGWSKSILINAKSETVMSKPTFSDAFRYRRCIVPCNGWYEWVKTDGTSQRYLFTASEPLYMAAIGYVAPTPSLVTLTQAPNTFYRAYHHRMPTLIKESNLEVYLNHSPTQALKLLHTQPMPEIEVVPYASGANG
ncbi:SOS response-associated peptidase [Thaumasiovibrio subtropicus]|uniref:SOS response-associated peptidase n=1 Tax=Thaumasiovibrio subtropicus TaxID=1891207 RepID=UPI000B353CC8|nr:SOS response-associated peptidase family protein [Thaumasiovibrio subtropicus]